MKTWILILSAFALGLGFEYLNAGSALAAAVVLVYLNWRAIS